MQAKAESDALTDIISELEIDAATCDCEIGVMVLAWW